MDAVEIVVDWNVGVTKGRLGNVEGKAMRFSISFGWERQWRDAVE